MKKVKRSTEKKKKQLDVKTLPPKWIEVFKNKSATGSSKNSWSWRVHDRNDCSNALYSASGYNSKKIAKKMAVRHAENSKINLPIFDV